METPPSREGLIKLLEKPDLSLHDRVLAAICALQFHGGGSGTVDEIMAVLEAANVVVDRTDVTAVLERLETEGLAAGASA